MVLGHITPAFSSGPGGAPLARHRAEPTTPCEPSKGRDARDRLLQRVVSGHNCSPIGAPPRVNPTSSHRQSYASVQSSGRGQVLLRCYGAATRGNTDPKRDRSAREHSARGTAGRSPRYGLEACDASPKPRTHQQPSRVLDGGNRWNLFSREAGRGTDQPLNHMSSQKLFSSSR